MVTKWVSCVVLLAPLVVGAQSPSTKDLAWLEGRWQGTMSNGSGIADVTFAPPAAGLITGVMRLVNDDKILVVELVSIVDTPNGPEMRFRHFSPSLEAYESTFKQAMRLVSHNATRFVFENTVPYDKTLMSTQPRVTVYERHRSDMFVGRSDIIGSDGKPSVIEVTYRRVFTPEQAAINAARDSAYVAMCQHRPGAKGRLDGCDLKGLVQERIPLFIIDDRRLPVDTIGPGRVEREKAINSLKAGDIDSVEVIKSDEPSAAALYGEEARFGVIKIKTKRSKVK